MSRMDDYTVEEVDKLIRKHKTIKEAAKEIGVNAQEVYAYRSKHAKEFRKLKSRDEQVLTADNEQMVTAKKVPLTASRIELQFPSNDEIFNENQEKAEKMKTLLDGINEMGQIAENLGKSAFTVSTPRHYAPTNNGVDVIGFTHMQMTAEEIRGATKMNILKYATRLGRKDDEIKELDKIIDYAQRYKKYLEGSK